MSIQFIDDGASIKVVTPNNTRTVQKDITKFNVNQTTNEHISMRSGKFGQQYRYDEITAPASTDIDNLRTILESWLDGASGGINLSGDLVDGAGRQEVALPVVLGDYKFIHDLLPLLMNIETIGGGTVVHNTTNNCARLSVTNNLDAAIIQSYQRHQYFSGKAQQPEFTHINLQPTVGVKKMIGYYSSSTTTPFNTVYDGMMLVSENTTISMEIHNAGSLVNSVDITNVTTTDGTPINWENFNVELLDFLYLGGTGLRHFMIVGAAGKMLIDTYNHSNTKASLILSRPNQPIRAEIRSSGGSAYLDFVCAQVTSSGAENQLTGIPTGHDSGNAKIALATSGTTYAMLAVRLKTTHLDSIIQQQNISATTDGATDTFIWRLHLNPTVTGTLTYNNVDNTALQLAKGDNTQTITPANYGHVLASGTGAGRNGNGDIVAAIRKLGAAINGTADRIILSYTPLNSGHNVTCTLTTIEL